MPIAVSLDLSPISQQEFADLDYHVMRVAFESQNQLSRLCDEAIYQNDLAARLAEEGLSVAKEVPIKAVHGDFAKVYSPDLVVANAGIYELKTTLGLAGAHEAQLLNYLFLCGAHHGKLVNFRPPHVESRFINTTLTPADRREFAVEMEAWQEPHRTDRDFRECVLGLLSDWGWGLDVALYTEALIHFGGGEASVVQRLPLSRGNTSLGSQLFHLLNPETAFRVTALTEGISNHEQHLRSLLHLSPLRTLQWVNLSRRKVHLVSLKRR